MKEEKKGNKKIVIIAIVVIVLLAIIVGIGCFIGYHKNQIDLLNAEGEKILNMQMLNENGSFNQDAEIDMTIRTKGGYAVVEKTVKDYLHDVQEQAKKATEIYDENKITEMMDIKNIKEDGPEFKNTKDKIANMKKESEEYLDKFVELCDINKLSAEIDDKDVNAYYKGFYKGIVENDEVKTSIENAKNEIVKSRKIINDSYDYLAKFINFLSDNKASWMINGEQIVFKSQSALNEFNKIIDEAQKLIEE